MELVIPRKYSELAAEKIANELKSFKGDRYGSAVKEFVASTLTNFCTQSERFAQVVYETEATLSDCCAKIMYKCGNHISDIDVYRGAVRYYFPNADIIFSMTIDASGAAPTKDEMAKPEKKPVPESNDNTAQPANAPAAKPRKAKQTKASIPAPDGKAPADGHKAASAKMAEPKSRKRAKKEDPSDDLIQLTLF